MWNQIKKSVVVELAEIINYKIYDILHEVIVKSTFPIENKRVVREFQQLLNNVNRLIFLPLDIRNTMNIERSILKIYVH